MDEKTRNTTDPWDDPYVDEPSDGYDSWDFLD